MSKHLDNVIAGTVLALALTTPAAYAQSDAKLDAAARLHAQAVVDTTKAQRFADESATKARKLVVTGTKRLERAAAIVARADAQAGAGPAAHAVVGAQVALSSDAARQAGALAELADETSGRVQAAAVKALARVARVEATVSADMAASASAGHAEAGGKVAGDLGEVRASVEATSSSLLRKVRRTLAAAKSKLDRALAQISGSASAEAHAEAHPGTGAHAGADGRGSLELSPLLGGGR